MEGQAGGSMRASWSSVLTCGCLPLPLSSWKWRRSKREGKVRREAEEKGKRKETPSEAAGASEAAVRTAKIQNAQFTRPTRLPRLPLTGESQQEQTAHREQTRQTQAAAGSDHGESAGAGPDGPHDDGLFSADYSSDEVAADEMDPQERRKHEIFMREALAQAEYALNHDETPVGCVFVHDNSIIGRGMNDTNHSLNGTRHAEFVAIASILETHNVKIFKETDLYVTVEPCIMCASALRQYGIRRVYFGCANDRFGGTGGVLSIHRDRSIDPPYQAIGGIFREEAIMLLRRFYIQENAKAPVPHKKNRILKEDIPPMQPSKTSFMDTPSAPHESTIAADQKMPSKISTPMPKIVPAVPILRPKISNASPVGAT